MAIIRNISKLPCLLRPLVSIFRGTTSSETRCKSDRMRRHGYNYFCTGSGTSPGLNVTISKEKILLEAVNTMSVDELYKYKSFTKQISYGIMKRRRMAGVISSIEELKQVPGITGERLEKICSAINGNQLKSDKPGQSFSLGSTIHPSLKIHEIPSSIVSIHMHLPRVSWIKLTRDLTVEDWQTASFVPEKKLKYDHAIYQSKVWELCHHIPTAELYLFEEAPLRVSTSQIMPSLNRSYVEAALTTALTCRHVPPPVPSNSLNGRPYEQLIRDPDGAMVDPNTNVITCNKDNFPPSHGEFKHVVYKLKPKTVSNYFSLLVGGERTSSLDLLRDIKDGVCAKAGRLNIEPEMWQELWQLPKVLQEQRAQALLVATTFYKLLMLGKDDTETSA